MKAGELLRLLQGARSMRDGWMARCPAHDDRTPSLSIAEEDGRILLFCHAGCTLEEICTALNIQERDLFSDEPQRAQNGAPTTRIIAEYDYVDESGTLRYQVVRLEPKTFRQRRPAGNGWIWNLKGVQQLLYRLPEVLAENSVLVCEGEKDCETARTLNIVATCNSGGAGKWRQGYSEHLRAKQVIIIADADEPGRKHAQEVAASVFGKASSIKVLELPSAKDLTEWVERGGNRDALLEQIRKAAEWTCAAEAPTMRAGAILRCFSDIAPKALRWLWPGRIPLGKLTLLIGDPGLGKSLLTADIASRVTCGTSFPDSATCESGSVIFLTAEDDPADTVRPRLDAAGADVSRAHILEAVRVRLADGSLTDKAFNLESDCAHLEAALREHQEVRLIVIDPISAYLGGVDSHSNAEVRGILAPLAELAGRFNVAVLLITHLRKTTGSAVYRAIDSIAFSAAARAVWAVAPDPEDGHRRLLLAVKQNLGADIGGLAFRVETVGATPRLAWESGPVALTANEILGNVDVQQDQNERREAKEWLKDVLADGPVATAKIQREVKAAGLSWMTVRRAKDALGVLACKNGYQGKWEWRLDDDQSEDAHAVDTQVSTFEEAAENRNVSSRGRTKDAHRPEGEHLRQPSIDGLGDNGEVRL